MIKELFDKIDAFKEKINAHRPCDPQSCQMLREYYRIGLTYTSNALEGNSLTESETKVVIEDGITIGGKRLLEHLEAIGHSDAYTYMYTLVQQNRITESDIQRLHHLFYYRIDEQRAGIYRNTQVYITGSQYPLPKPVELAERMHRLIDTFDRLRYDIHPVEFAARLHNEFVFIHPFVDGNGRVARLLMNLALLQAGYTITLIPAVVRGQYISLLEKAHKDDSGFIEFIAQMVYETQKDHIRLFGE